MGPKSASPPSLRQKKRLHGLGEAFMQLAFSSHPYTIALDAFPLETFVTLTI